MLTTADLKARCDAAADATDEQLSEYEAVVAKYSELGLPAMDDGSDLMFSNHVLCVIKRVHAGECLDETPEELFEEISQPARDASLGLLAGVFSAHGQQPNKTEVLMLATHLEVAMQAAQQ